MTEARELSVKEFSGIKIDEKRLAISMGNKTVRFGEIGGKQAAIKIWDKNGNGEPEKELKAYQRLQATALGEFTPEPVCLIRNGLKKVTGLAIEARKGEMLTVYQTQEKKPLTKEMVDGLAAAVLETYDNGRGLALDYKMLEPDNLGLDENGLWFCCCGLGEPAKNYEETIKQMTGYLRKNFCRE